MSKSEEIMGKTSLNVEAKKKTIMLRETFENRSNKQTC